MADLIAPLPLVRLYGGMTIRLEAVDAAGNPVAGVAVTDVAIYGASIGEGAEDETLLPVFLQSVDV
jgi:hypothetical protein